MASNEFPELDIILPCYNPGKGWAGNIVACMLSVQKEIPNVDIHLIIVNDGSQKSFSKEGIEEIKTGLPEVEVILEENPENRGKGNALRRGIKAAQSPFQIYTDVDFPYTQASLTGIYHQLARGESDIVAGVRDQNYYQGVPAQRKLISKFVRWLLRTFLRLKITDTQCGLKGFNAKGKATFLQTSIDRFLFDMEFIFLASNQKNIRLAPAIVELKPHIVFSKMSWPILFHEGLNFLGIFFRFLSKGK